MTKKSLENKEKPKKVRKLLPGNLTPKQELFCRLYATQGDYFGNGTKAYAEAYEITLSPKNYKAVQSSASDNLSKPIIIDRITDLLDTVGFNDANVDKQHLFLINQFDDLKTKMSAIKEYNAVKNRVRKEETGDTYNQYNIMVKAGDDPEAMNIKFKEFLESKKVHIGD